VLQARKPYLLNLPCTDKRLASIFQLTIHVFLFLALVPLSSHNRYSLQNAVVQKKKTKMNDVQLTAIYYHHNQPWQKKSEFPLRLDYGRSPHAYVNQRLQIQLELPMMSGIALETCWAFNERWNNKFCYKVASCWLFLL